jgi:hypothetical protein
MKVQIKIAGTLKLKESLDQETKGLMDNQLLMQHSKNMAVPSQDR